MNFLALCHATKFFIYLTCQDRLLTVELVKPLDFITTKTANSVFVRNDLIQFLFTQNSNNTLLTANFNLLTPNDDYSGRTAPLTSKRCILCIYSTHTGTEYFKHGITLRFFPLQNAVCFINIAYLVSVLFTFYIQDVLK